MYYEENMGKFRTNTQSIATRVYAMLFALLTVSIIITSILFARCLKSHGDLSYVIESLKLKIRQCDNCHSDASCSNVINSTFQCYCKKGYEGDGITYCKDISFAVKYYYKTKKYIPTISTDFPEQNELSACVWIKMSSIPETNSSIWKYSTNRENLIFLIADKQFVVKKGDTVIKAPNHVLPSKQWVHLCWLWKTTGNWTLLKNGNIIHQVVSNQNTFSQPLPKGRGEFTLGNIIKKGYNNTGEMLGSKISQFYLYNRLLSITEVLQLFTFRPPPLNGLLLGWWSWKNITNKTTKVDFNTNIV